MSDDTDQVPEPVRRRVRDWFAGTTNEERIDWANEHDAHDQLQRMQRINERAKAEAQARHNEKVVEAREKDLSEMTMDEKLALVREDGKEALVDKVNESSPSGPTTVDEVRDRFR